MSSAVIREARFTLESLEQQTDEARRALIALSCLETYWNETEAAKISGMSRGQFQYWRRKYGIGLMCDITGVRLEEQSETAPEQE